jgi:ABC-type multidrug transport system fused ATPase/permease subunit
MAELLAGGGVVRGRAVSAVLALGAMCARSVSSSAAATPTPGNAQTWVQKLGGKLWPPRRAQYPYYIVSAILMYAGLYCSHLRYVRTREAEEEDRRKREYALISMKHMVQYEDARERLQASKAARDDDAAGAEEANEPPKTSSEDAADAKEVKTLKPADAKKLFDLLYDHVESAPITKIGVSDDNEMYVRLKALLGQRTSEELVNETARTRTARAGEATMMDVDEYEDEVGKYSAREYHDGQRLIKKVKFAKDSVCKIFGKDMVEAEALSDGRAVIAEIAETRKAARRRILRLITPHFPKWLAGTLILMATETCFAFLRAWSFGLAQSLTQLPGPHTMANTLRDCITLGIGYILIFPIDTVGDALIDDVEAEVQLKLRSAIMSTVLAQDREYFDTHQVGELQERLNNDTALVARMAIAQPKTLCSSITRFTANAIVMAFLSPQLALLALALPVPFSIAVGLIAVRLTRRQNKKIGRANDRAAAGTIEVLRELSTVRQFGMEREEVSMYCETAKWRMQLERRLRVTSTVTSVTAFQAFRIARMTNIYYGVLFVVRGTMEATTVLMAVMNSQVIIDSAQSIFNVASEIMLVMEPLERVAALLESKPKIEPPPDTYADVIRGTAHSSSTETHSSSLGLRPETFAGNFVFEDVHFAYPTEKQKRVLNGMSFEVDPGTKVALVGKAGCGKSTAISLVQRFYDPLQGRVLLDGAPLVDFDLHYLRAHIGVVAQDNVLFSKSLWDNITYGMGTGGLPVATKQMVDAACAAANATDFINEFPNKLATLVGEKGVKLSGGQKQRIAIARAIIRSPPILLLDEATSALDSVNEKIVQKALDEMLLKHNGVAIVIAHRLTTIKNCDKIVVCDKGVKVEEGTHEDLLKIPVTYEDEEQDTKKGQKEGATPASGNKNQQQVSTGHYHKLWDTQMGEETINLALEDAGMNDVAAKIVALQRSVDETDAALLQWTHHAAALQQAAEDAVERG